MVSSKDFNQAQIHTVRFLLTTYLQYTVDIVELRYFVLQETKTSCQETRLHLRIMHIEIFARIIFAVHILLFFTFVKMLLLLASSLLWQHLQVDGPKTSLSTIEHILLKVISSYTILYSPVHRPGISWNVSCTVADFIWHLWACLFIQGEWLISWPYGTYTNTLVSCSGSMRCKV